VHAHTVARLVRPVNAAPARPGGSGKRQCAEACAPDVELLIQV